MVIKRKKREDSRAQLEFSFGRPKEKDRNAHLGGKSFYFFDFDDNVVYLSTPIVLFHKKTNKEVFVGSGEFAQENKRIGKSGPYADYYLNFDDLTGSFRYFRDHSFGLLDKIVRKKQTFVQDVAKAIQNAEYDWKAPSWNCFYHATFNNRPTSVITARGHDSDTIKEGVKLMVKEGHLPHEPNFLSIYPVSNPEVRVALGDKELTSSIAELKRGAIRESVEEAIRIYGYSPHHRFGMSDDDPHNVELITEEMKTLKRKYPEMSFFVIHTHQDHFVKEEVLQHKLKRKKKSQNFEQVALI
ncbi:MAG: hypothetical protein CME70_03880 [Halobacteriovorax sp.]|nr:hypothetical protein [Halobacteriovorax sp.]|tara:strand:- start:137081 stop:137977 length:897 start_codon:yes stop_codon:yes gene_type:complete